MRSLYICFALAAGETIACLVPGGTALWPFAALSAALVFSIGYGCRMRGWTFLSVCLVGLSLFWLASRESELELRESPWLRGARSRRTAGTVPGWMEGVKADMSRRIGIGGDSAALAANLNRAILLGERERMPRAVKNTFVRSGTIHVFAVSGLHVMVIARLLTILMMLLFIPARWAGALALPPLWFYVVMIGSPPSAVRAAIMASCYLSAPACWRRPDALRAWTFAFLVMHLACPRLIANVGSQLSFAVMLALVLASRRLSGLGAFRQHLLLTAIAWLAGAPIVACVFGQVAPGAILANLILIGAATGSVMAGTAGLLLSYVSDQLAAHLNQLASLFTEWMVATADFVSRLPWGCLEVSSLSSHSLALLAALFVCLWSYLLGASPFREGSWRKL